MENNTNTNATAAKKKKKKNPFLIALFIFLGVIFVLLIAFLIYLSIYAKADEKADQALASDDTVKVEEIDEGYFFDGPSEDKAIIFYPGAKVETKAYAPLLHEVAREDADVFLLSMPFHMAFFSIHKADTIKAKYSSYTSYFMAGHSLGAAMAGEYVSSHLEDYKGLIFLAGYPTKDLHHDGFSLLSVYGSKDGHTSMLAKNPEYRPADYTEVVIEGGNHAQFGNYCIQSGDGEASITREKQQQETVLAIGDYLSKH